MSDQLCSAHACPYPTAGASLCENHTNLLTTLLDTLPQDVIHLRESALRQVNYSQVGGMLVGSDDESPLPFNTRASNLERKAVRTIRLWQGRAADYVGIPVRHPVPLRAVSWLVDNVESGRLAGWVGLGNMFDAFNELSTEILKTIDRPDTAWYAGSCGALIVDDDGNPLDCPTELYVSEGAATVECPKCGTTFDIKERRDVLLSEVDQVLATATEIARALTVLDDQTGETNLVRRIGAWKDRGRINPRGSRLEHGIQRPTYRVGEVRALLALEAQRAYLKKTRKKAT